jgi:hypothetical protein
MKKVHISITIPCAESHRVFHALYAEDGATKFSFIKKYSAYNAEVMSPDILKITNEYRTLFGKVSQDIRVVDQRKLFFQGRGPCGISFNGCWTVQPLALRLDQTITCPGPLAGRVKRRVLSIAQHVSRAHEKNIA